MERMLLIGTEEVSHAAGRMQQAADGMKQAASSMEWTNGQFLRRFEELVGRMEEALANKKAP
jgi:hypothetical protein